ncbi:MAG TPA: carbohydrate ABC transporter permease [Dongiaceae bacterium]|jgi:trehalose/maltose transport system permease protein|nr:carbohydrate ABC transporter permease [Dongiaceae bacterium]
MIRRFCMQVVFAVLVAIVTLYAVLPFLWAVISSLKTGSALFAGPIIPAHPAWENYLSVFRQQDFGRSILNSLLVAISTVALSLSLALATAYALGRVNFRGRRLLLFTVLGVSMFPQIAVLSGMFELVTVLGLYNNPLAMIFSYLLFTLPFTVWVLTSFMREVPRELEEAALADGAGPLTILVKIFLPILMPSVATTGLLAFIAAWNEFLFALTFTLTPDQRTVPVAIALISGASAHELPWGNIMAASVIVTLPLIVLVLIFQRKIVAGLTAGAVKG